MSMERQLQAFLYLLPIFLPFFFLLLLNILAKPNQTKRKKSLPGPWRLPFLGNLHLLNPNNLQHSLLTLSNKYGPLILLQLGSIPTVLVSSRHIAEKIFTNNDLTFSNRPALTALTKFFYNNSSMAFASHGDQWRQARKITIIELLSPRRVRSFEAVRREEVEKLAAAIKHLSVVNLSELTLSLANNIVCRAMLGDEFGGGGYGGKEGVWLHRLLSETQSLIGGFFVADYFPNWMKWVDRLRGFQERLEKTFEEMDKLFDRVIVEHLREEESGHGNKDGGDEGKDLLHVLLRLHKVARLHGGFLSNIDHVKAMLVVS